MEKINVQIGELSFELSPPRNEEDDPSLEIENNTSAILVKVSLEKARELKVLLERFIGEFHAK